MKGVEEILLIVTSIAKMFANSSPYGTLWHNLDINFYMYMIRIGWDSRWFFLQFLGTYLGQWLDHMTMKE